MKSFKRIESLVFKREQKAILKQLFDIGQLDPILNHPSFSVDALKNLLKTLAPVDTFYKELGGIKGYHQRALELLFPKKEKVHATLFHPPSFTDISQLNKTVEKTIEDGIESLNKVAEIIPPRGCCRSIASRR